MPTENVYQENGFDNRDDYLANLADEYGVSTDTVFALSDMLGESEDFDGLVSALESC